VAEPIAPEGDSETSRATAHLPGLSIEIVHRLSPSRDAELLAINLQAVPSFEAFGRWLEATNPFVMWMQAAQLFWSPWLGPANAGLFPGAGAHPTRLRRRD
jgi:hypothetical protein